MKQTGVANPSVQSLFIILFLLSGGFILLFLIGWGHYSFAEPAIGASNLHKAGETKWVVFLFALPYIGQVVSMISLYSKLRKDNSKASKTCYFFSLATGCVLFSYSLLWALYSFYSGYSNNRSSAYLHFFSLLALCAIALLLVPVVLLTYSIRWSPSHPSLSKPPLLKIADLTSWTKFRSKVLEDHPGRTPGRRILDCLPDRISESYAHESKYDEVDRDEFFAALNKSLENPDFYQPDFFRGKPVDDELKKDLARCKKDLTTNEVHWVNRRLLEACYSDIKKNGADYSIPSQRSRKWTNLLTELKHGVEKAPFWALVFSFSVFLAVTYLFGFAFAFHDKKMLQEWKAPALYMGQSYPSATSELSPSEEQVIVQGIRAPEFIPWPEYSFYFDPNRASLSYRPNFDEQEYKELVKEVQDRGGRFKNNPARILQELEGKNKEWGENKNVEHLSKMADAIEKSTNDDRAIFVKLNGSADDSQLKELTRYSSNYALSEARAQNVKFLLMTRLWEASLAQRRIEWVCLPLSSEVLAKPPSNKKELSLKGQREQLAGFIKSASIDPKDQDALVFALDRINILDERVSLPPEQERELLKKVDQLRLSLIEGQFSRGKLTDAQRLVAEKQLPPDQTKFILDKLNDAGQELDEKLDQLKTELLEAIDFVDHVEKNAGRRVVIATIVPIRNNVQPALVNKNDQQFIPLNLLDYMYFTIYTITTTGYGDIVPITTYAKFLCSLANILEVFFLVVFFNALLSVRGGGKPGHTSDHER